MRFERQIIYKKYHASKDPSYILVLNTGRVGMTLVSISSKAAMIYKGIKDLYITDLDMYVSIERMDYIKYSNIDRIAYEKYRALSDREMRRITSVIKEFFDGDLVYSENGLLCYADEIYQQNDYADSSKSDMTDTTTEDDVIPAETCVDQSVAEETVYVDLLKVDDTDQKTYGSECKSSSNIANKRSNTNNRRYFTEDEVRAICNMRTNVIKTKFKVTSATAARMKANAIEYFNGKKDSSFEKNDYMSLFEGGLTYEDVLELFPESNKHSIKKSYERYATKKKLQNIDVNAVISDITNGDLEGILSIADMSFKDIGTNYNCSYSNAQKIGFAIRNYLSKDIFFVVFGSIAYRKNEFTDFIKDARNSTDSVVKSIDIFNYETCLRLRSAYEETFDDHQDILGGIKQVPEYIKGTDRDRFMYILDRRFNKYCQYDTNDEKIVNLCKSKNVAELATLKVIGYIRSNSYIDRYRKKHGIG